ncbi:MAG: amidohydrolase family protein [Actinobacteria bacterium]|nr:amidohydrolase family protein [Actinomycetota bacterium]
MLVVHGARVYPGEGLPYEADVAVVGRSIVAIGANLPRSDCQVVDGTGCLLCPGFIDLHAHSALASFEDPLLTPKILQGFTTEVICPDGLAPAPVADRSARQAYLRALEGGGPAHWGWTSFAEYLDALAATRPALTLVPSAAHGAVRDFVLGSGNVSPTAPQLEAMRAEVRLGFEAGARMLSFGLVYFPGAFAGTEELVALAEVAAEFGAPLVPHVRNEGAGVLDAVKEMVEVSRRSGAPLHLSHLKCLADETLIEPLLAYVDESGATFDQYPYGAGSTLLASLLPGWAQEGGAAATLARIAQPETRARIAADVAVGLPGWENQLGTLGPERIDVDGSSIADRGGDAVETVLDLLLESDLAAAMILHYASDASVRLVARDPHQLVGSDGIFGAHPHPRLYGTAPRFLGRFVLREGLLPVEEGVARLTARAADRLGLADRGRIEVGLRADFVLLDPDRYVDDATYADPKRSPEGVRGVWVAGEAVVRDGRVTGARPGGVLRR